MSACLPPPSTIVVASLSTVIFLARPSCSSVRFSSFMPRSSLISVPPVRTAMSPSMALRRSPKPGAFTAQTLQHAAELVDHQRRQGLALDVLGDDQQRLARWADLLQQRNQVADVADLLLVDQDQGVLQQAVHLRRAVDEVGREVALVELHPLDDLVGGLGGLAFLDGDHAVLADLLHRLGQQVADDLCRCWR